MLARQLRFEISVKAKEKGWSERTCRYDMIFVRLGLKCILPELLQYSSLKENNPVLLLNICNIIKTK